MNIKEIQEKTSPIFTEYGVAKASLVGSVSRGEDTKDSDVDILITMGAPMGMFTYMRLLQEL